MMYLITVLSVISAAILVVLIKPLISRKSRKSALSQRSIIILGVVFLLCLTGIAAVRVHMTKKKSSSGVNEQVQKVLDEKSKDTPKNKATATLPAYEVVSRPEDNKGQRMITFTSSKDRAQLVLLHEKLESEFKKSPTSSLSFEYFDNKKVALIYFASVEDPKTTAAQRKELFNHYTATGGNKITNADNLLMLGDIKNITKQLNQPTATSAPEKK